jgi:NADH-quinone oxidoreductase subunit L
LLELVLDIAWLIPVFPLLAFAAIVFFTNRWKEFSARLAIGAMGISFLLSLGVLGAVVQSGGQEAFERSYAWAPVGQSTLSMGYRIDPLTTVMLMVVSFVGLLIFIYSQGYMHGDKRYSRFFAYMALFGASMLTLVLANNLVLLYISWELVGLCSYLLIGFWFEKTSAANAAKKAFITTRLGDVGLFIGLLLLYSLTGHVDFSGVFQAIPGLDPSILALIGILIFAGAVGKSAQFPLHVWLPDAMEGPTPVSALIHPATMVAAGVYLVGRSYPIFAAVQGLPSLQVVAWIGAITAVLAASIGLAVTDIKRVLAYSTISQLGYMMIGLGVGGVAAGIFHLMTHAFFKALLFLGSGSVIYGTGTQDIYQMGGLRKHMPTTFWTFLFGTLALAGIFPFAGFWSKDEILLGAFEHNRPIFLVALFTAFLTAFYMFRAVFVAFYGQPRDRHVHAHESPPVMTVPLIILAVFALIAGWVGIPFIGNPLAHYLEGAEAMVENANLGLEIGLMALSTVVALTGIGAAYWLYHRRQPRTVEEDPLRGLGPLWTLLRNKWYFDEFYGATVVKGTLVLADAFRAFDLGIVDGLVNLAGYATVAFSRLQRWIDTHIVDGAVNAVGWVTTKGGNALKYVQTGQVQNYGLVIFVGIILLMALFTSK